MNPATVEENDGVSLRERLIPENVDRNGAVPTLSDSEGKCSKFFCGWSQSNKEIQGFGLISSTLGILMVQGVLIVNSLLQFSQKATQEKCGSDAEKASCKIYGSNPDTIIANASTITLILVALFMPVVGAILDYTPHRRLTELRHL